MTRVPPRWQPQDGIDVCLSLLVGGGLAVILYVIPGLIVGITTGSWRVGVLTGLGIAGLFMSMSVSELRLDRTGVRFVRMIGWPRFLHWDDIVDLAEVSRSEVVLHGWIWPPMPARDMTPSMTALRHVRIATRDGRRVYFPPESIEEFEEAVRRYAPPDFQAAVRRPGADHL